MRLLLSFSLLVFSIQGNASANDTLETRLLSLFRKADIVMEIEMDTVACEHWFSIFDDLGSAQVYPSYKILRFLKRADTNDVTPFSMEVSYLSPCGDFSPGKRFIVFLEREPSLRGSEFRSPNYNWKKGFNLYLVQNGAIESSTWLNKRMEKMTGSTSFDRAVYKGKWKAAERKIKRHIRKGSHLSKKKNSQGYRNFISWINTQNTVHKFTPDTCSDIIAIYPSWSTYAIRLVSEEGPKDFGFSIVHGKVRRVSGIYYRLGISPEVNRMFWGKFSEAPYLFDQIHESCLISSFQPLTYEYYINQQTEIKVTGKLLTDTINAGSPVIPVLVTLKNISAEPRTVWWPDKQNDGNKIIYFTLVGKSGMILREDEYFSIPRDKTLGPSMITLMPGDTLSAIHTVNFPYSAYTDIKGHHTIQWVPEDDYAVQVNYDPSVLDGDTIFCWNPENGIRTVSCAQVLSVLSPTPMDTITVVGELLETRKNYINAYDQNAEYNGLIRVWTSSPGSGINAGDTIAYRSNLNRLYELYTEFYEKARNHHDAQPGDTMQLKIKASFPADGFLSGNSAVKSYSIHDIQDGEIILQRK